MQRTSTLFLKIVICLTGLAVLLGLLWFPQTEGGAVHLDLVQIYADPVIIYMYIASIPFFAGLFQAIKLLGLIDANKAFSLGAVKTLRNMKIASVSLIGFILLGLVYIRFFAHGDDPAGPSMLGFILIIAFGAIGTATALFERLFQNAVDMKSENDLTV